MKKNFMIPERVQTNSAQHNTAQHSAVHQRTQDTAKHNTMLNVEHRTQVYS
jgi:hypothetical protein